MPKLTKLLVFLLLVSCNSTPKEADGRNQTRDTVHSHEDGGADFQKDTLLLNGLTLIQNTKAGRFISLVTLSGDTIVKDKDYYFQVAYPDINEDGFKDIRISVVSKTPNQSENYFYDEQALTFRPIDHSDLDIRKLKGTLLYYSYNGAGCSDQSWESRLSKIENWTEITIGYIRAKGCGDKEDGIYIYKVAGNKDTLLEKLPIEVIEQGKGDKWYFIEQYWTRNFDQFEP